MSENLRNSINDLFSEEPDAEEKAWDMIHEFYHLVLTKMERDGITRADLARKLGKSRASVSQMFNKTPNLSIMKMMEIADAVDLNISLKEGKREGVIDGVRERRGEIAKMRQWDVGKSGNQ